jgi:ankyrin repeat protein
MHWAAESGHTDTVRVLAEYNAAGVLMQDERGKTPKSLAIQECHSEAEDLLSAIENEDYVCVDIQTELTMSRAIK